MINNTNKKDTMMNFKDLFNTTITNDFILKNKDRAESCFRIAAKQLKVIKTDPDAHKISLTGWRRLTMGYRGIGFCGGIPPRLKTKEVMPNVSTSNDHVIGTTLCGEIVEDLLEKNDYDFKYLIDNWLYDNLYLWGTIKVTKAQHHKDNILRNANTLEEKIMLKHYKNIDLEDLIII